MRENFDKIIVFTLLKEGWKSGGNVDPTDPGGVTIWGWAFSSHSDIVKKLLPMSEADSREEAINLYLTDIWMEPLERPNKLEAG